MTKKLISLILVLPLILMLCLFTAVNTVGLTVDVPVSKIEILGTKVVYLDLDKEENYRVDYAVYPTTASNQKVAFSTEPVGTAAYADLEYKDGYIYPKTVGTAKVFLTTADGGFKDSLLVQVDSNSLQSIECGLENAHLFVGEKTTVVAQCIPQNAATNLLEYSSSNENVAIVNDKGVVTAVGRGEAVITVSSEEKPTVFDSVTVYVETNDVLNIGVVSGYVSQQQGEVGVTVAVAQGETYTLEYVACNEQGEETALGEIFTSGEFGTPDENGNLKFHYTFREDFYGTVVLKMKITTLSGSVEKSCTLQRLDGIRVSFDSETPVQTTVDTKFRLDTQMTIIPEDATATYSVQELSNGNVAVDATGNRLRMSANAPGVTTAVIQVKVVGSDGVEVPFYLEKEIVVLPTALTITEVADTYGIEGVWTIGKQMPNGADSAYALHLAYGNTTAGEGFAENLYFETDTPKVRVAQNGVISMDADFMGLVSVTAKFAYNGVEKVSETFTLRCVGDAVNVSNYLDLLTATRAEKPVVLQGNIKDDFGRDANGNVVYTEMVSTYDTTYYANIGKPNPKVKVLLQFKADLYGNGYEINAHNVAYGLDSSGQLKNDALFRGPLNFVAMSETESSSVSVKAQDNICFAVYENTKINNVELRACDLIADTDGNYDLTDLDYVGTTVEVLGDNVDIEYSRITNGRTVLRIFGDAADSSKAIHVNVQNSVLSSAREFVVRMGSNAFEGGSSDNAAPYLQGDTSLSFPAQKAYAAMTAQQKTAYDNKFIKTFVHMKNCVMQNAGIFTVGMDTHFSGSALADGSGFLGGTLLSSWHDMAKTAYGAKLTFEGDVRMYDWKEVDSVNSDTLIEIVGETAYGGIRFDVKELIQEIAENENLKTIVYDGRGDSKQYVHGGIAFFGGGKNYSVFEMQNYTFKALNGYGVKLSDVGKAELQLAAGNEGFYFMLHDSNTLDFLPQHQDSILQSGNAYDCIYQK